MLQGREPDQDVEWRLLLGPAAGCRLNCMDLKISSFIVAGPETGLRAGGARAARPAQRRRVAAAAGPDAHKVGQDGAEGKASIPGPA